MNKFTKKRKLNKNKDLNVKVMERSENLNSNKLKSKYTKKKIHDAKYIHDKNKYRQFKYIYPKLEVNNSHQDILKYIRANTIVSGETNHHIRKYHTYIKHKGL